MESVIPSTVDPSGFQQKQQQQQQQHQLLPNRPLASPQLSQEFVSKSPAPAAPPAPIPSPQRMLSLNDGTLYTRNLLLRGMCLIYLMAFVGFYYQSPGLFGNNGILPARIQIEGTNTVASMHQKPSLLHLARYLGLDTEYMMDVLALLGIGIAFTGFVWQKVCILHTFSALWSLYFSLVQVSQVFGNQSDNLLLEAGLIVLLLAPLNYTNRSGPTDKIGFVMIRWLMLRFLLESGSIKLFVRCPLWWNFTALRHHFETLPLPTPLSWYSFNHPVAVMKVGNIFTNLTELVCSWFFFFPHRTVRRYVFYWQIYLQMWIILTGNYGFLNFLMPVLLLSLLDDDFFLDKNRNAWFMCKLMCCLSLLFEVVSYVLAGPFESFTFDDGWLSMLRSTVKPAPMMAMCIVLATSLQTMATHPQISRSRSILQKLSVGNAFVFCTIASLMLILVSMVPHGNLDRATNITNTPLGSLFEQAEKFHVVHQYGQHLQRMRTERLEIIYEHAQDIEGPWHEYGHLYKPHNVNGSLTFAGPYFPRFDHKFYDASASTYRQQLWTVSTAFRLLQNNPDVLALFGATEIVPPPRYVRALLYRFQYNELSNGPNYWTRQIRGEYFPAFSLDNPTFVGYLRSMRISPNYKPKPVSNWLLKWWLNLVRKLAQQFSGTALVVAVVAAGIAIIYTKKPQAESLLSMRY